MNILALDLGSTTGIAIGRTNENPRCESIVWASAAELRKAKQQRYDRRGDIRVKTFFYWLQKQNAQLVVFEDVQFSSSTAQTQLWSSFRTAVWLAFPSSFVECVPTGTLKKFATGNGAADKPAMAIALAKKHPSIFRHDMDDNAVDAAWLWLWAEKNLGRMAQ